METEKVDQCWDGLTPDGYGKSRYDIARAIIQADRAQRQAGPYLDGVEAERLTAALSWMGCTPPESQEALAANVDTYVNRLTRAVLKHKADTEKQRQAGQEPVLWRYKDTESVVAAMPGYAPGADWTPIYAAPQPAPSPQGMLDVCTDGDNCRRCQTRPKHRGSISHAGIPAGNSYGAPDHPR